MTGSSIQTGFRHICRNSAATLENENVADRSERCKQTSQRQFHEGKGRTVHKMYFRDDDDSEFYETTASQDERIEQDLQQEKDEETSREALEESKRKEAFEREFQEQNHEIFDLPGLTFLKYTHTKIKFFFEPRKVVTHVRADVKFYCSLRYYKRYHVWNVRHDSFPVNYKTRIYGIFYRNKFFSVKDDTVADAIFRVYIQLKLWAQGEEEYRLEKFSRYQNGEDVYLDADDEELFLTEDQRNELHAKREAVLRRMIPPTDPGSRELPPEPRRRKHKQAVRAESTSEEQKSPPKRKGRRRRPKKIQSSNSSA